MTLVALCDRDHEAEVGVDHQLLRRLVTALDALRERDLLGRGEQGVPARPVHEQGERVRRAVGGVGLPDDLLLLLGNEDLDVAGVQFGAEGGDVLLLELVLGREGLEGRLLNGAALLGVLQERMDGCVKHL